MKDIYKVSYSNKINKTKFMFLIPYYLEIR